MGITTEKYIRKPLYVDAVRVTRENFDEIADWCQGTVEVEESRGETADRSYVRVRVHHPKDAKQTKAFVGDWLLYTEKGYKVYTNPAFLRSFDLVSEVEGDSKPPEDVALQSENGVHPIEGVAGEEPIPGENAPDPGDTPIPGEQPIANDKRVLTQDEQKTMDQDEIRELIRSGEAILEQDLV